MHTLIIHDPLHPSKTHKRFQRQLRLPGKATIITRKKGTGNERGINIRTGRETVLEEWLKRREEQTDERTRPALLFPLVHCFLFCSIQSYYLRSTSCYLLFTTYYLYYLLLTINHLSLSIITQRYLSPLSATTSYPLPIYVLTTKSNTSIIVVIRRESEYEL